MQDFDLEIKHVFLFYFCLITEDGKEVTTTKTITTIRSKETTFDGEKEIDDKEDEKDENEGEDDDEDRAAEAEVGSAEASPTKEAQSPTKKKKKFRTPSFLKSKKKERKTES